MVLFHRFARHPACGSGRSNGLRPHTGLCGIGLCAVGCSRRRCDADAEFDARAILLARRHSALYLLCRNDDVLYQVFVNGFGHLAAKRSLV